ncbi:MAG TPA: hypothetical protein VMH30_00625 [Verrucomicrobiae bacterium]|nr:hypothetical protein [Verrucomicrobiae bacterium]
MAKGLCENVVAGILACRGGRHPAARDDRPRMRKDNNGFLDYAARPPGWKPRLDVSQDG